MTVAQNFDIGRVCQTFNRMAGVTDDVQFQRQVSEGVAEQLIISFRAPGGNEVRWCIAVIDSHVLGDVQLPAKQNRRKRRVFELE